MDKSQALYRFWHSFGVDSYDENTVPEDASFPRITYDVAEGEFGDNVAMNASVWDRSTSWISVERLKNAIADRLKNGGCQIRYDDGIIWIKKGSPFAQRMGDSDDTIRRIVLNIEAEYMEG